MRFGKEIRQLIKISNITNFPIGLAEIKSIIEYSGWEIYSYKSAGEIIDNYNLYTMTESNDSFAAHIGNRTVIFYDDNISQLDFPHILAHEIGHIVLGHLDDTNDIYAKERDCECFADELLKYSPFPFSILINSAIVLGCAVIFAIILNFSMTGDSSVIISTETNSSSYSTVNSTNSAEISLNNIVYITQYGEKYHIHGCQYVRGKDNLLEISVEQAENAGYEPCEICFGDRNNSN